MEARFAVVLSADGRGRSLGGAREGGPVGLYARLGSGDCVDEVGSY